VKNVAGQRGKVALPRRNDYEAFFPKLPERRAERGWAAEQAIAASACNPPRR